MLYHETVKEVSTRLKTVDKKDIVSEESTKAEETLNTTIVICIVSVYVVHSQKAEIVMLRHPERSEKRQLIVALPEVIRPIFKGRCSFYTRDCLFKVT